MQSTIEETVREAAEALTLKALEDTEMFLRSLWGDRYEMWQAARKGMMDALINSH